MELGDKYSEKDIVCTWNNLKTYFEREKLREEGSKKSGTGTSQVKNSIPLNSINTYLCSLF